jgi:hypothetical protein
MKVLLEHLIDKCLTQNNVKHNYQQRTVDVTVELSAGMVHALVSLTMSTFWLLICLTKEPALSGYRYSNGNALLSSLIQSKSDAVHCPISTTKSGKSKIFLNLLNVYLSCLLPIK